MTMLKAFALWLLSATALAVDIKSNSIAGQKLLENARRLADNNNNADLSYLAQYSIKFQGCHHVQQWNDNVDEENDVRIMTKRLARFRLCPSDQCSNDRSSGCSSKYGDYVVDMDTFIDAYLTAMADGKDVICAEYATDCAAKCANNDDDCVTTCYASYDMSYCLNDGYDNGFDPKDYASCTAFQMNGGRRRLDQNAAAYYIGAFCADQGGEIHLGLFTDDTCTSFASNGYTLFKSTMGYSMPYSETSLVSTRCLTCGTSNGNGYTSNEVCENPYKMAGKCETKMSIDYPNESSCNYIEGIKIIREDGVIRTSAVKKSKAAAVGIGLFTTMSVLLAAYVYYLRTKLARAQINLAAAAQPFDTGMS